MKILKMLCLLFVCGSGVVCPDEVLTENGDSTHTVKSEYGKTIDSIFTQARNKIKIGEDITDVEWLNLKIKTEFRDIHNLMADISLAVNFDQKATDVICQQLQECLRSTMKDEVSKVCAISDVTVEAVEDFFHLSDIVCGLTQGSDVMCHNMMHGLKKENRLFLKTLEITEKATKKMREIERKQEKKERMRRLREHIVLGAHQR